jgi:hypothetical protein
MGVPAVRNEVSTAGAEAGGTGPREFKTQFD